MQNTNVKETIHKSLEYEYAALGMLIKNSDLIDEALNYIDADCFYDIQNKYMFNIFSQMFADPIIKDEFNKLTETEIINYLLSNPINGKNNIDHEYLFLLIANAGLVENKIFYFSELSRLANLRKLEMALNKSLNYLSNTNGVKVDEFMAKLDKEIIETNVKHQVNELEKANTISAEFFEDLNKRRNSDLNEFVGVASGFSDLDEYTQGFKSGELIIIAARPAMGKTAFALNIAINAAIAGKKVAFFSMEMSGLQLMSRIFSSVSEVPGDKLKKPQYISNVEWMRISSAKNSVIDHMDLFIDDSTSSKLNELKWKAQRLHQTSGVDLIVVDYLQLLVTGEKSNDNRQNEVAKISRSLKQLARELDIPIIALSQLSRNVETREDKRPLMSDLRESGSIEQDADIVMFLFREGYYNKHKKNQEEQNINYNNNNYELGEPTELIIGKHRNGATGTIKLRFQMSISKFSDVIKK